MDLLAGGDFETRKNDEAVRFKESAQAIHCIDVAMVRDANDLDPKRQAPVEHLLVVAGFIQPVLGAAIFGLVAGRVDLQGTAPEARDCVAGLENGFSFHVRPLRWALSATGISGPCRNSLSTALRTSHATLTSSRVAIICRASSCRLGNVTVTRLISVSTERVMAKPAATCIKLLHLSANAFSVGTPSPVRAHLHLRAT